MLIITLIYNTIILSTIRSDLEPLLEYLDSESFFPREELIFYMAGSAGEVLVAVAGRSAVPGVYRTSGSRVPVRNSVTGFMNRLGRLQNL